MSQIKPKAREIMNNIETNKNKTQVSLFSSERMIYRKNTKEATNVYLNI